MLVSLPHSVAASYAAVLLIIPPGARLTRAKLRLLLARRSRNELLRYGGNAFLDEDQGIFNDLSS
jgi:hypothetical protein